MDTLTATRVLAGPRRGSSRPVLVDTASGPRLVKLRGAAQGTGALVAEVIVAALAEALDLRVPTRSLVALDLDIATDDRDEELADLLAASVGLNLGFAVLDGARDVVASDLRRFSPAQAATVLWLDRLVLNPDRTSGNPNLLWSGEQAYLIDHGAALSFQYNWAAVTEATPRKAGAMLGSHIFEAAAGSEHWAAWDAELASRVTRSVLENAAAEVPATFLVPMLPAGAYTASSASLAEAVRRRRAAYVAFLWKRLKPPRAFVSAVPPSAAA